MLLQVSQVKRAAPITPRAKDIVATVLSHKRRELGPIHEELLKVVALHWRNSLMPEESRAETKVWSFVRRPRLDEMQTRSSVNCLDEVLLNDVLHWSLGMHKFN